MKKQTAVEWLETELKKIPFVKVNEVFKQAKEMEKEQIIDAHIIGDNTYTVGGAYLYDAAEQYFNETYKQQTP